MKEPFNRDSIQYAKTQPDKAAENIQKLRAMFGGQPNRFEEGKKRNEQIRRNV